MAKAEGLAEHAGWEVALDIYEGPLDLLLHLIRTLEIDIYDIPIAEITDQYLRYIQAMKEWQLDVASDYLVMAATLMQIKSEMLVPRNENQSDELEEVEEDPRQQLVDMLLEYRKYKKASKKLQQKEEQRAYFHTKLPADVSSYQQNILLEKTDLDAFDLFDVMKKMLAASRLQKPQDTTIAADELTVFDQTQWIKEALTAQQSGRVTFSSLLKQRTKPEIVVTFLALLELMKENKIKVKQASSQADIEISRVPGA